LSGKSGRKAEQKTRNLLGKSLVEGETIENGRFFGLENPYPTSGKTKWKPTACFDQETTL
jgi:hypothetical protein